MKYMKQFLIIISISFIGELLKWVIPLPISASIYGMVLLFLCLEFKLIQVSDVKETSDFLIEIMPILFIPAAVGLMKSWGYIADSWFAYIVTTIVSTFVVMIVSGTVTQWILKLKGKKGGEERA